MLFREIFVQKYYLMDIGFFAFMQRMTKNAEINSYHIKI